MTLRTVAALRFSPESRDRRARPDGLAFADVAFDQHAQQVLGALVQRVVLQFGHRSEVNHCSDGKFTDQAATR